jgi:Fic family protein
MTKYIWERTRWPDMTFDAGKLSVPLAAVRHAQGRLLGRMESLGFKLRDEAWLQTLTQDVIKTSEIEGERLDTHQVRSSIARRLGMDIGALAPVDRHVEGIVEVMLDATQNCAKPLTVKRLYSWHGALFPTGRSGMSKIRVAKWRDDTQGPMQVISGPVGKEKIHFRAPPADRLSDEIRRFLMWFENFEYDLDGVIKAGLAHLWLVTIHPFDDGNGRIARAVGDMALARSEQTHQRFYSLSSQIQLERNDYYDILEKTQKGDLDVTEWLQWFLVCLDRSIQRADDTLSAVMEKARFWDHFNDAQLNDRQIKVLNRMFDGFEGNLTTSKWAKLTKCSQDTAYRDILALVELGALRADGAGRNTHYVLVSKDA